MPVSTHYPFCDFKIPVGTATLLRLLWEDKNGTQINTTQLQLWVSWLYLPQSSRFQHINVYRCNTLQGSFSHLYSGKAEDLGIQTIQISCISSRSGCVSSRYGKMVTSQYQLETDDQASLKLKLKNGVPGTLRPPKKAAMLQGQDISRRIFPKKVKINLPFTSLNLNVWDTPKKNTNINIVNKKNVPN